MTVSSSQHLQVPSSQPPVSSLDIASSDGCSGFSGIPLCAFFIIGSSPRGVVDEVVLDCAVTPQRKHTKKVLVMVGIAASGSAFADPVSCNVSSESEESNCDFDEEIWSE